jgi:phenylpropionate dioxygenase-like ring-hydroxylating dioxygenase large terminal subunit
MQGRFDNNRYSSEDWLKLENERLFSKLWIFFCPKAMVDRPNRYMTREIAGVPVVVQNFDGEIRAFRNVCLHRQFPLQTEEFGERRLICGYHGWRYDADGSIAALPLNNDYHKLDDAEICRHRLKTYSVKILGEFVFINLDESPIPIEQQFSPAIIADLESMEGAFDREILIAKIHCDYNWKLIYENLKDVIHPRFLHQQSLALDVLIEPSDLPNDYYERQRQAPDLVKLSYGGAAHPFTNDRTPDYAARVERWRNVDAYFNWLLFPNTHVVSPNGGYVFSIEHHMPISPTRSELTIFYFTAKSKSHLPASVLWEHLQGAKEVLDEDNKAMDEVQKVVARGPQFATLGAGEYEIAEMQNWLSSHVGDAQ